MKKFKIIYSFNGNGVSKIKAKNEEEAREIFYNGDMGEEQETEQGTNYEIEQIEEIKEKKVSNPYAKYLKLDFKGKKFNKIQNIVVKKK